MLSCAESLSNTDVYLKPPRGRELNKQPGVAGMSGDCEAFLCCGLLEFISRANQNIELISSLKQHLIKRALIALFATDSDSKAKSKGVNFVAFVCGYSTAHMPRGFVQSITLVSEGFHYSSRRWLGRRGRLLEQHAAGDN